MTPVHTKSISNDPVAHKVTTPLHTKMLLNDPFAHNETFGNALYSTERQVQCCVTLEELLCNDTVAHTVTTPLHTQYRHLCIIIIISAPLHTKSLCNAPFAHTVTTPLHTKLGGYGQ